MSSHRSDGLERFRRPAKPTAAPAPRRSPGSGLSVVSPIVERERRTRRVLRELNEIPTLPDVVWNVMALANDTNTRARDFEEVIQRDQSLAGKVLKLVNSSFFGLRQKVTSISQAVVLLGFNTIKSVVIAAKTSHLLNRQLATYGFDAGGMWAHSISCATASHFVARRLELDRDERDELFVAGLLHDVGKVVIAPHLARLEAEFQTALDSRGGDFVLAERALIGISHDELGGAIAERWNLAPGLVELMRRHHDGATDARAPRSLRVLQLANDLCHELGVGRVSGPREAGRRREEWLVELGLGDDRTIVADLRKSLDELQSVFLSLAEGR